MKLHLITFSIAAMQFGVDSSIVDCVISRQPLRALRLIPAWIAGIVPIRGDVLSAIDIAALLGLTPTVRSHVDGLVVRSADEALVLIADALGGVVAIDQNSKSAPPTDATAAVRNVCKEWYASEAGGIGELDLKKLLEPLSKHVTDRNQGGIHGVA